MKTDLEMAVMRRNSSDQTLRLLAWLHLGYGATAGAVLLVSFLFSNRSLDMSAAIVTHYSAVDQQVWVLVQTMAALLSTAEVLAGAGLLLGKTWSIAWLRVLGLAQLLVFPVGTALGAFTLWALRKPGPDAQRTVG